MKKVLLFVVALVAISTLFSCEKNELDQKVPVEHTVDTLVSQDPQSDARLVQAIADSMSRSGSRSSVSYYQGSSNHRIVNNPGTSYVWIVYDYGTMPQRPYVKVFGPDSQTSYYAMTRSSNGQYWSLVGSLPKRGHNVWRYVSSTYQNLTSWNTWIDNTYIRVNLSGTSTLKWPFGYQDATTWNNQGLWTMNCGPGCNAHSGSFYYSYDWNWNASNPTSDNGKILASPVDGVIENISSYSTSYGTAWQIIVKQTYGDSYVRFMFGHIQSSALVSIGAYVKAGDPIARLGATGASSPHAHSMLLQANGQSIPLQFSAQ